MSEYVEQMMRGIAEVGRRVELAIFTGWASGGWYAFSRCCSAETYVESQNYYAGTPSCTKCHRGLGPKDIRSEWVPPKKMDPNSKMDCPFPTEPEDA